MNITQTWWGRLMLAGAVCLAGAISAHAEGQESSSQDAGPPAATSSVSSTSTSTESSAPPAEAAAPSAEPPSAATAEEEEPAAVPAVPEPAAPSAEAPEAAPVAQGEGLISVDFKDADIRQVLRIISLKSGVDIVAGTNVEGLVTIKLTNVPWEQALDIILRTYGFTYERKEKIVRVMTVDDLEKEALSTEVFPLDYAKAKEVPDIINEMLSERGRVKFDERTNTIIVTDVPSNLFQIKEVIKRLDQRTPQVVINARIVETKLEKNENLGIDWSDSLDATLTGSTATTPFPFPADVSFGSVGDRFLPLLFPRGGTVTFGTLSAPDWAWTFNMLKSRSDTHIVSNPTLAVLNNQQAKIHIGEEFPVPNFAVDSSTGKTTVSGFQQKTIGTILTVTPHVNPSDEIVVDLKPEISSVGTNATFVVGDGGETVELPRFGLQTVTTSVRIRDGETIAIGGLVKDLELVQENKVPLLGDLPLIGALFKNTQKFGGSDNPTLKQDLLIFLTVSLMAESPPRTKEVASTPASDAAP